MRTPLTNAGSVLRRRCENLQQAMRQCCDHSVVRRIPLFPGTRSAVRHFLDANRRTARKASDVRRFAVALTAQSVSRTSHFLLLSDTFCWCRLPRLRPSHPIPLPSNNVKARNIALLAHFVRIFACRARSVGLPVSVRHRVKSAPTPTPPPRCFAV